ncbi:Tripartite-type tricarboxylate transporter, receptor component TctC [Cupriavidus sp. YR651]|uniref:Bug family tripartite tricarboxylate transporter substrate binding protein n=1 Tax=Cupriavidus sp. YR651 TaxID=1855315 RepID=UPI000887B096|nr:tripartite tricarboxylate transporter substrate binding protein [Cupriavidus sp. YR651]SDD71885.1 Tripartite-type tricarboxylate transporter, receptor component TctC [Cupriavidus sp. YR651]
MKPSLCSSLAAICMSLATVAFGQPTGDYPTRPVKLIVPSAAGGGADAFGRLLGDQLSKRLKQPFVVENIAGAAGTIAIGQLAHARPDGYTIALGTMTTTTLAPAVYHQLPYDPVKGLTTLARVGTSPIILVATTDLPANNLKELIELAKRSQKPIQFGTWGQGSTGHFCAEVLAQKAGIKLDHIPFKGGAAVMTAMMGDVIKVGWLDIGSGTAAVKTGKIKPLAMCTRRTANFPNVATYKEQGVDFDQWTGWAMYAPAGVPKPIVDKIAAALKDTLQDPSVMAKMNDWGITPDYLGGAEQAAVNVREIEVWKRVAREANITLD